MDLYRQQAHNRRMTVALMAGLMAILALLGFSCELVVDHGQGFPIAGVTSVLGSLALASVAYFRGDRIVLGSLGARPLDPQVLAERQLENVVEEMCLAAGLPKPAIYILPDADPNALATGRDPAHAAIAVTEGLLECLNREELQAVVAHELGHVKNLDIRTMTITSVFLGAIALLADAMSQGQRASSTNRSKSKNGGSVGPLIVLVAAAAVVSSRLLAMAVSRTREFEADRSAAEFTRNPLALASALRKLEARRTPTRIATQGTAHLFVVDPRVSALNDREDLAANLFATHPPVARRIARLEALAGGTLKDIA